MPIIGAARSRARSPFAPDYGGGGGVAWLTPASIPGFRKKVIIRPGDRDFVSLMGLAIAAGRRGLGAVDPCGNTGEVLYNGVCTLPQYVPINQPPNVIESGGGSSTLVPAKCPVVGPAGPYAMCDYGGAPLPCSEIRECDPMTGAVHFQYSTPGGIAVNPDMATVDYATGKVIGCQGSCAVPVGVQLTDVGSGNVVYKPSTTPTGGGGGTAGGGAAGGTGAAAPVALTFQNVSRPGLPLQVGDHWSLTIQGSPNAPVTADAKQDGRVVGRGTSFGKTDASGKLVLSGVMTADTVGVWEETFYVGGLSADLSFTVSGASSAGGSGSTGSDKTGGGGSTNTGDTKFTNNTGLTTKGACTALFSKWTDEPCVGPVGAYTLAAAVIAAYFLFFKGRR